MKGKNDNGIKAIQEDATTRNLSKVLEEMNDQKEAADFVIRHGADINDSFHKLLERKMKKTGIPKVDVAKRSGISSNYVYNIISGSKQNPGRDKVIALCVASEMTYKETQHALEITGLAPLYPRDERDVRIAIAINTGIKNVMDVNLLLADHGLEPLDV